MAAGDLQTPLQQKSIFLGDATEDNFLYKTQNPHFRNNNKGLQNQKISISLENIKADKNPNLEQANTDPNSQMLQLV